LSRRAVVVTVVLLAAGPAAQAAAPKPASPKPAAPKPLPPPVLKPPTVPAVPIPALFETDPVVGNGDAADDMAIWINRQDRSKSLVIGTDKKAGNLEVYDLAGHRLQRIADKNHSVNNVDLRYDFPLGGQLVDIVVSGGTDVAVYKIDPLSRQLVDVTARVIRPTYNAWGVCLYHSPISGAFSVFTTDNNGEVEQLELFDDGHGKVDARSVRGPWDVHPQPVVVVDGEIEACTADDSTGDFYVSEQDVAVWRYGAEPTDSITEDRRTAVITTYLVNDGFMVPDIEGIVIVHDQFGSYLLASSQGDSTFGLYYLDESVAPYPLMTKFRITGGPFADGCSITDGIDATPLYLNADFPHGLFVCQDNTNTKPGGAGTQDFKLVPLDRIIPWINPYGV
jgi:myo-inositol-hexaphosphate 3-phosphohydrolase